MDAITIDELERGADDFDRVVANTPGIDHFCSSSAWILPAQSALMPHREPWLFRGRDGYLTMMRGAHHEGWHYIEPFESMWGLACPAVGAAPGPLSTEVAKLLRQRAGDWDVALFSGIGPESDLCHELVAALSLCARIRLGPRTARHVARLDDGFSAYLGRRSRNVRRSLKRSLREAERVGIEFLQLEADDPAGALAIYERILAVESRSWKGRTGVGINDGCLHGFYREMVPRLAERGLLRVSLARHDGRDIGYILGSVFLGTYRGLQFSYDAAYQRFSLGNLCQYHQIEALCREGVERYDLGTDMDYKRRWADGTQETISLIVIRR
ncbi:MAG: hypothetical protein Tsb0020_09530 [Haliangiales bacterium]